MIRVELLRILLKFVFCTFLRVKVEGAEKVPKEGPLLILANHTGILDMFMVGYRLPRLVHWMAKAELFKNKFFARIITFLGAYPVNRGAHDTAAARKTFELLNQGEMVGIFPQGTRARKGKPVPRAKSGAVKYAVETDTLVVPVAIWGNKRLFGKMHVKFGEPFRFPQPAEGQKYTREEFNEMAQKLIDDIYAMSGEDSINGNNKG